MQDESRQLEKDIMWARENIPAAAAALLGDQVLTHHPEPRTPNPEP
jgi:hypothetical protein